MATGSLGNHDHEENNPNGDSRSATAVLLGDTGDWTRLRVGLGDADAGGSETSRSFSFLHFVGMIQERRSSHPETSAGPYSGGKQTFLDRIK